MNAEGQGLSSPSRPVLEVRNLSVRFGGFQALDDLSWAAHAGRILGIIGPNGAGKSTCFQAASNMVPHTGTVWVDGADVSAVAPQRLARMGLRRTFQQNAFFGGMTVLENMLGVLGGTPLAVSLALPWVERRRRRDLAAAARAHLESFGIGAELHPRLPGALSYGTQRLLSIALACAPGARVVMLDEPAAGLGGADMERLAALLARLRHGGLAVVLIEHHMDLVMGIADQIVAIDLGRLLAAGRPAAIQADARVLEAYLGRAA